MADGKFLFTSESVSMGHPDKVSDQVSDGVLDALLAQDPQSRVACETLCTTNFVELAGEITSKAKVDYEPFDNWRFTLEGNLFCGHSYDGHNGGIYGGFHDNDSIGVAVRWSF